MLGAFSECIFGVRFRSIEQWPLRKRTVGLDSSEKWHISEELELDQPSRDGDWWRLTLHFGVSIVGHSLREGRLSDHVYM